MMANVSVGALFLAGILPGVLMALLMMLTVAYFAHKNGWGGDIKFSGSRFGKAMIETAVVVAWPLAVYWLVQAGAAAAAHGGCRRWSCCSPPTATSASRPCCRS